MRVVLVGPELEENLALRYLASALAGAKHTAVVIAFNRSAQVDRVASAILDQDPGLVGFSLVAQRRYEDFVRLADLLRSRGYGGHITAGGHFAGLRAAEVLADTLSLDSIVHHDGEERIVALVNWLEKCTPGATPSEPPPEFDGISWRGEDGTPRHRPPRRVGDIDRLAPPRRRKPDRTLGYARAPLVSSRGCSGSCSFCSIHAWHRQVPSGRLRFRAPSQVAGEMLALHREHGVRVFVFHDDDFIHPDPAEASRRCQAILDEAQHGIGAPIAFVVKCRPDDVEKDLFSYLKARGLVRVYVGIETHSLAGIRTLNRRVTPEQNNRALTTLRELGVYSCFNLLLFHPETTPAELGENLDFLERSAMHPFDIARAELYARSSLEDRMVREGRTIGDYRGFDYLIADRQAEAIFRLFAAALWDRHFGGSSILHRSQELGYRASLLRRLHPELVSPGLQDKVDSLIREVNRDTISFMRRMVGEVVKTGTQWNIGRHRELVHALRHEVAVRLRRQDRLSSRLSLELEGRARLGRLLFDPARGARRLDRSQGVPAWTRRVGRVAAALPFATAALGLISCGGSEPQVCDPPPPPSVRFVTDIEPHLAASCALADCHAQQAAAAGLVLESGASYDELVEKPSTQVPSLKRVHAGRPNSSYLVNKLEETQATAGGSGVRMPKSGAIDGDFLENLKQWIRNGAAKE